MGVDVKELTVKVPESPKIDEKKVEPKKVEYEIRNDTLNLSKDIYSYTYFNFVKNHNPVRLICTFIMHLYTFPNIRRGQQMIQFALYNTHKFPQRSAFWPLILACLKMVGALAAEYGNIFNIMRDQSVGQVIGGYITMSIIAKTEGIMALTLT